jgi:hypothetical protein
VRLLCLSFNDGGLLCLSFTDGEMLFYNKFFYFPASSSYATFDINALSL